MLFLLLILIFLTLVVVLIVVAKVNDLADRVEKIGSSIFSNVNQVKIGVNKIMDGNVNTNERLTQIESAVGNIETAVTREKAEADAQIEALNAEIARLRDNQVDTSRLENIAARLNAASENIGNIVTGISTEGSTPVGFPEPPAPNPNEAPLDPREATTEEFPASAPSESAQAFDQIADELQAGETSPFDNSAAQSVSTDETQTAPPSAVGEADSGGVSAPTSSDSLAGDLDSAPQSETTGNPSSSSNE